MLGFWLIMLLLAGWQGKKLINRESWRELVVFLFAWLTAVIYGSLVISEFDLISPFQLIIKVFD